MKIQKMIVDSSNCKSDLCEIGGTLGTDKSPYNQRGHRHPYTAVYSLLLSRFRFQPVRFAEIGIAGGHSIIMWRMFFLHMHTHIFAFDSCEITRKNLDNFNLLEVSSHHMDVSDSDSIKSSLQDIGGNLDILLDDSSHNFIHQINVIKSAIPYVKSGGMIIIEDVYRSYNEQKFENELQDVLHQFSFVSLIVTDHKDRYSPGWDNDQLLVLIKK